MPKPNNSIKVSNRSITQIPDKMAPEEVTTILGNLRAEMISLIKVFQCRSNLHHAEKITILQDISIL